jgi:hypothetical protein
MEMRVQPPVKVEVLSTKALFRVKNIHEYVLLPSSDEVDQPKLVKLHHIQTNSP